MCNLMYHWEQQNNSMPLFTLLDAIVYLVWIDEFHIVSIVTYIMTIEWHTALNPALSK